MTPPYFYKVFSQNNENLTLRVVVIAFQRCLGYASAEHFFRELNTQHPMYNHCTSTIPSGIYDGLSLLLVSLEKPPPHFRHFFILNNNH